MKTCEALAELAAAYKSNGWLSIVCIESEGVNSDDSRRVELCCEGDFDEPCFVCTREQYGERVECGIPFNRDDWQLTDRGDT